MCASKYERCYRNSAWMSEPERQRRAASSRPFAGAQARKDRVMPTDTLELATTIRAHALRMIAKGEGRRNVGTCMSMADLLAVLYGSCLRIDPKTAAMARARSADRQQGARRRHPVCGARGGAASFRLAIS